MKNSIFFGVSLALLTSLVSTASAITLSGTVNNDENNPIEGAKVELLNHAKSTLTDNQGKFSFELILDGIQLAKAPGYFSLNHGILDFSQNGTEKIQVKIFDLVGNKIFEETFQGAGSVDINNFVKSQGTYLAQIKMGSAQESFRFVSNKSYNGSVSSNNNTLKKLNEGTVNGNTNTSTLQVSFEGYDTLKVTLKNLDTNVTLTMKKKAPVSSEQTYAFGYALKNSPRPTSGCGKEPVLKGTMSWNCDRSEGGDCNEDAQQFSINAGGEERSYYMTFPKNYDKNKPYKLLIANHCMGSSSNHMATWINVNQDHPSPYYGQLNLDKESNYIFVAPQGEGNGTWGKGEKDHEFISKMLAHIESNYCIDSSRVFATGFSFGAMFSNSLAQTFQDRIRAVAVYAVADFNIYLPTNAGKPIAWMDVHGVQDGLCSYDRLNSSITRILKNNGPDGKDVSSEVNQMERYKGGNNHVCYDFKQVDPRFPVKVCTWGGGHQWTANDNGNWRDTWVPKTVHEFFEQF